MSKEKIQVNLDECELVSCNCGSDVWMDITKIRRVKGVMVGQSHDQFVKQPATVCVKCGVTFDPKYKKQIKLEKV